MSTAMRVAVVGAGVVGLSIVYSLRARGFSVTCLDAGAPMAARSTGSSRIFRLAHGDPELVRYARTAGEIFADWSRRAGTPLVRTSGVVVTGDTCAEWAAAMASAGAEHTWHQEPPDPLGLPVAGLPGPALVDPAGGVIDVPATGRFLLDAVGDAVHTARVDRVEPRGDTAILHTSNSPLETDRVLLAAGAGTAELAAGCGIDVPADRAHHARFTFRLLDPDAAPPCWLNKSGGLTTYQQQSGAGRWSVGAELSPAESAWERGREAVTARSRELVTEYVRDELRGVGTEIVEVVYCDFPPGLGDGIHVASSGPVTAVWGDNLFKHAPAIGAALAANVAS